MCCLMLCCFIGNAMAQHDQPIVIKTTIGSTDHYLAHDQVGGVWKVVDATTFGPNCIWYSGPDYNLTGNHHNYYFNDGTNNRFLTAPLEEGDVITLSPSTPAPYLLQNTDQIYYFYDWDRDNLPSYGEGGGVARGHQYPGVSEPDCPSCGGVWGDNECWKVHYVEYNVTSGKWQMSENHYHITTTGGRYRTVTFSESTTVTSGGLGTLSDFGLNFGGNKHLLVTINPHYQYTVNTNYRFYETTQSAVTDHIINTEDGADAVAVDDDYLSIAFHIGHTAAAVDSAVNQGMGFFLRGEGINRRITGCCR